GEQSKSTVIRSTGTIGLPFVIPPSYGILARGPTAAELNHRDRLIGRQPLLLCHGVGLPRRTRASSTNGSTNSHETAIINERSLTGAVNFARAPANAVATMSRASLVTIAVWLTWLPLSWKATGPSASSVRARSTGPRFTLTIESQCGFGRLLVRDGVPSR